MADFCVFVQQSTFQKVRVRRDKLWKSSKFEDHCKKKSCEQALDFNFDTKKCIKIVVIDSISITLA